jgi:hypothetical protein
MSNSELRDLDDQLPDPSTSSKANAFDVLMSPKARGKTATEPPRKKTPAKASAIRAGTSATLVAAPAAAAVPHRMIVKRKRKAPHSIQAAMLRASWAAGEDAVFSQIETKLQHRQETNIKERATATIFDLGRGYEGRTKKLASGVFEDDVVKRALDGKDAGIYKTICKNLVGFLERLQLRCTPQGKVHGHEDGFSYNTTRRLIHCNIHKQR